MHFDLIAIAVVAAAVSIGPALAETLGIEEYKLDNGLTVLIREDHSSPVVSVQVWYKVGGRFDQTGVTGISHFLEHMMFEGTERYGPGEMDRIIRRNGGEKNAFTGRDYTAYYENLASDRYEIALDIEADRMHNLALHPDRIARERGAVLEERRLRENSPTGRLFEELSSAAYMAHPYQWPILGWTSDIESITRDDLLKHYRTYYVPNNATVIIIGDVSPKEALARVEEHFGEIPRGEDPPPVRTKEPTQTGERRVVVRKEAETPYVIVAYHAPELGHPDEYVLQVIEEIISTGKSSRLYRELVREQGIALSAWGGYEMRADPSLFYCGGTPESGHTAEELEQAIYTQIERLKSEPVSERELTKAANQIEARLIFSLDRNYRMGTMLGRYATQLSYHYLGELLPNIRAVTAEDILRVAKKYFVTQNRTVATLIPLEGTPDSTDEKGT
jgi:zinc protease